MASFIYKEIVKKGIQSLNSNEVKNPGAGFQSQRLYPGNKLPRSRAFDVLPETIYLAAKLRRTNHTEIRKNVHKYN